MVMRWDPLTPAVSLHDAMNRLFSESFVNPASWWTPTSSGTYFPFDLYESAEELVCRTAIPGADPNSLELTVDNGVLTLRGYRGFYSGEEERQYRWHTRGLSEGEFQFSISLPTKVEAGSAQATYDAGSITIHLPKAEDVKARRIQVRSAAAPEELPAGSR